jgi:hypothetical protein
MKNDTYILHFMKEVLDMVASHDNPKGQILSIFHHKLGSFCMVGHGIWIEK